MNKIKKGNYILGIIILIVIAIIIILNDFKLTEVDLKIFKFSEREQVKTDEAVIVKPKLNISGVKVRYYDLSYRLIPNVGYEDDINLNEAVRMEFFLELFNETGENIVVDIRKKSLENTDGHIIERFTKIDDWGNVILTPGEKKEFPISGITTASHLKACEYGNCELVINTETEYFIESKPENKFNLNQYMVCYNLYKEAELPRFNFTCERRNK